MLSRGAVSVAQIGNVCMYSMTTAYTHGAPESSSSLVTAHDSTGRAQSHVRDSQRGGPSPHALSRDRPFITAARTETREACSASTTDGGRVGSGQAQFHVGLTWKDGSAAVAAAAASREGPASQPAPEGEGGGGCMLPLVPLTSRPHYSRGSHGRASDKQLCHCSLPPSLPDLRPRARVSDARPSCRVPPTPAVPSRTAVGPLRRPMTSLLCQRVERPLARSTQETPLSARGRRAPGHVAILNCLEQ